MIRQVLLLFFLMFPFCFSASTQTVKELKLVFKGKSYGFYTLDNPETYSNLLLGFHDQEGEAWSAQSWTQELSWLSKARRSNLFVPQIDFPEMTADVLAALIKTHYQNTNPDSVFFIAFGSGANKTCSLVKEGMPGVFIAPLKSCKIGEAKTESAVSILNSRESDSSKVWQDSLERAGWWVQEKMVISADPYYVHNHESLITEQFNWIEEKLNSLNNPNQTPSITQLETPIPEVIKQGKPIDFSISVANHGIFEIKLLDLGSQPQYKNNIFLGKGIHKFSILTKDLNWGVYKLEIDGPEFLEKHKVMIRG